MSQDPPAIALAGLTIHAPGSRGAALLGPVDLEIQRGEHVLIVGPSGGGKTTLLRAIAGLSEPTTGTVHLHGKLASDSSGLLIRPEDREVGMLFQGAALWPHMSVRKTLSFVLKQAGKDASRSSIAGLLEEVHLAGYEKRMPATLSGGERQRLALARAMATEPSILLLDEPLGPLDKELRSDLLQTLGRLHEQRGWTTLHVTHDPGEAEHLAQRIVRIEDGRIAPLAETQPPQEG